jgi:hypothetical protein
VHEAFYYFVRSWVVSLSDHFLAINTFQNENIKCREKEIIFPEIAVLLKPLRLVSEVQQGNQP